MLAQPDVTASIRATTESCTQRDGTAGSFVRKELQHTRGEFCRTLQTVTISPHSSILRLTCERVRTSSSMGPIGSEHDDLAAIPGTIIAAVALAAGVGIDACRIDDPGDAVQEAGMPEAESAAYRDIHHSYGAERAGHQSCKQGTGCTLYAHGASTYLVSRRAGLERLRKRVGACSTRTSRRSRPLRLGEVPTRWRRGPTGVRSHPPGRHVGRRPVRRKARLRLRDATLENPGPGRRVRPVRANPPPDETREEREISRRGRRERRAETRRSGFEVSPARRVSKFFPKISASRLCGLCG